MLHFTIDQTSLSICYPIFCRLFFQLIQYQEEKDVYLRLKHLQIVANFLHIGANTPSAEKSFILTLFPHLI